MLDIPVRDELRLAVAMNGGVSLAVWIGGVATELERFRSAEANGSSWKTARTDLGIERVVIDVLAGSSAGGLNAVFLALAQAFDDVALDQLRDVWFELADFDTELLRSASVAKPLTPLDGEYFLRQLQSRIAALVDERRPSHNAVDLRVTATSLRGEREDFPDLIGSHFVNSRHEVSFRFRTDPTGRPGDFSDPSADGTLVKNLATAGRASASFPVAFEPVLVNPADFGPAAAGIAQGFDQRRFLADGGILDNLPVGRAVEAIFRQPADEPVNRVLLAVIPLHQERLPDGEAQADDLAHPYSTFSVGFASGVSIPRNETSASGLHELDRLNRDSSMLVTARTSLFGLPFADLRSTGEGLWPVYVAQQMAIAREGDPGVDEQPPWLPPDPWMHASRRSGAAVRRAAAIVLDVLTRVADGGENGTPPDIVAERRRRVYECIEAAAELDPYDPEDPQLAPTRSFLFDVHQGRDGQIVDVGSELGGLFERLARIIGEVAPRAVAIGGLRSLESVVTDHDAWRWLTALEVGQGALGPSVNPQSMVHSAIVSPARAALIDPQQRVMPNMKLAGDDLGHFGAFLKRAWRANDWMWGRLDAASALGAICARLGLGESTVTTVVTEAQNAIVREEAPAIVAAIAHDLARGAKSPRGCELINDGKTTKPSKELLDQLGHPTWDELVERIGLSGPEPEREFLRRLNLGQETVKDELRGPLLVRVGTRFAAVMTKTAINARFPSLVQRFLNVLLFPLRGVTAAASRFTGASRQPLLGLLAVLLFAAGAADVLGVFDLGSFAVLVWPAAAGLALLRLAEAPVTTLVFALVICGVGFAYVLVDSDRWSPGSPYEAYLQNRAFVVAAMALLWIVMGLREVQRLDDLVAKLRSRPPRDRPM